MPLTVSNPFELLVDDHHGQYVGQVFAETIKRECFPTITAEDWHILESGPDHEHYLDVSADLDSHETETGESLWWHDGALWLVDWSLIGDSYDLQDIGEEAAVAFEADSDAWSLYCQLRANLYDGLGHGVWSEECLRAMRDHVERIADAIAASLPRYVLTDYGIEETDIDVEAALLAAHIGLRELSRYW